MMKRAFIGLAKPRFEYESVESMPAAPEQIPTPKKVTFFFKGNKNGNGAVLLKTGDKVKTCQKLSLYEESDDYVISSVTGTIAALCPYVGDFGQQYTAVSIDVAKQEETDKEFASQIKSPTLETVRDFFGAVPGNPPVTAFLNPDKPIHTMVICGSDDDLLITTHQYVMKSDIDAINRGISVLKKVTGIEQIVIAMPQQLMKSASSIGGASGVELRTVGTEYPSGLPQLVVKDSLGKIIPAGKTCEDMGICFLNAESVASIGKAVNTGEMPTTKTVTLIKKDLSRVLVAAKIGTPIRDILNFCDVTLNDKDRIVIGGPMRGAAIFSEDYPVQSDTDAIMVQDAANVPLISDYPCTNCGECIRICPANVPVNMLVRFCEAGQYEVAADEYNLYSCIECGLCSVVCVSRMPIFQYIRLAKYELDRIRKETEAANA